MGEVIQLAPYRQARRPRTRARVAPLRVEFFFDLACPSGYLVAERVERAFDDVRWTPASMLALHPGSRDAAALEATRRAAEARAVALRLPLVWPDRWPEAVPAAMRVAAYAGECGRAAAFVLAAGRLAFGGGFDLDEPDSLAEAAAAAGLAVDAALAAAADPARDAAAEAAGRTLLAARADRLPALRVGRSLFWGENPVAEAAAVARLQAAAGGR